MAEQDDPEGKILYDFTREDGLHIVNRTVPFGTILIIYESRPDITSIIHAHPPALVAFSIAGAVPDTKIVPQAHNVCGDIGFAPYGTPGSEDLGEKIAEEFISSADAAVGAVGSFGAISETFFSFDAAGESFVMKPFSFAI